MHLERTTTRTGDGIRSVGSTHLSLSRLSVRGVYVHLWNPESSSFPALKVTLGAWVMPRA